MKGTSTDKKISIESGFNSDSTKQEIITHLQNLIDVCYDGKKLTWTDLNEVQDLIEKVKGLND